MQHFFGSICIINIFVIENNRYEVTSCFLQKHELEITDPSMTALKKTSKFQFVQP